MDERLFMRVKTSVPFIINQIQLLSETYFLIISYCSVKIGINNKKLNKRAEFIVGRFEEMC